MRTTDVLTVVILRDVRRHGELASFDGRVLRTGDIVQLARHDAEYLIRARFARSYLRAHRRWASDEDPWPLSDA